jgi:hypothetical protein
MDFALDLGCSALHHINYETMNSGNTQTAQTAMTLAANPIVEKCLAKMANDVTAQVRDKLIDIIIAVLTRECEDFDGETVRRLIVAELDSTPICFALEKRVAVSKTPKTVELDADGNTVKKVRTPKEPKEKAPKALKEKAPKAPKPVLTEEEREARKAAKQAEREAAKEARKAEKAAAKDADKEAAKEAAKLAKQAEKEAAKLAKQAERDAAKAAKKAEKEAAEPVAKPVKEQRIPTPWCGVRISDRCEALRAYHGLFAQCTADTTETSMFCTSCEKTGAQFGTVTMRAACGLFDYTAPNGKKCVRLANVVDKFEVEGGIDAFVAEAAKHGITIPAEHLEKEVKQRGRPKSTSPRASTATKIATSDTGSGSGSETETDDEEYQAKKQAKQQQRKKVTKTAAAAADTDAAPKKRGRPAKAKEPVVEPKDSLIQDLVASAKKSASATPTPKAATPAAATPAAATPELIDDEVIITTPISSPAAAAAAVVAPAAPKKAAGASIKPKAAPKPVRKVVELDGDKFWEESFEGTDLYVRCSDNIAFDRSNGNGVGTWDDKTKTLIEDDESDADDEE